MTNGNSSAYPRTQLSSDGERIVHVNDGFTKREIIAAMAMQGMLSNSFLMDILVNARLDSDSNIYIIAEDAVNAADKLLEALK